VRQCEIKTGFFVQEIEQSIALMASSFGVTGGKVNCHAGVFVVRGARAGIELVWPMRARIWGLVNNKRREEAVGGI
jgi:hypothetical protein